MSVKSFRLRIRVEKIGLYTIKIENLTWQYSNQCMTLGSFCLKITTQNLKKRNSKRAVPFHAFKYRNFISDQI